MRADDIAQLTDCMVADCRLETASIFFVDRSEENSRVSYLYHTGVSDEAQHSYAARGIYRTDPFARLNDACPKSCEFVAWGDARLGIDSGDCADYRAFLAQHDIGVVGALSRRITPTLHLVIGAHRLGRTQWRDAVPMPQLERQIRCLSDLVVEHFIGEMLGHSAGRLALQMVLPSASGAMSPGASLSHREMEIAALICGGAQNKHVAHALDISQFTVENHLRRIYRKLGIHTRAALVAHFTGWAH